jgi:acyl-CoA synthetase (AMP-forming)/AMP-acid ligase II/acyl carrier protein
MGIGSHDRVAIALPDGLKMAVAFLAVASIATCAPLNPAYRSQEFDFYLSDLNAKALIVQSGVADAARIVAKERGITIIELTLDLTLEAGIFTLNSGESQHPADDSFTQANDDDIALVLHTSGTTSRPKIVPLTHKNLWTSAQNIRLVLKLSQSDRCLNIMPLFHIHGLIACLLSSLSAGASVICTPGFNAPQFFAWLAELQPTWYSAVPTMHQSILTRAEFNKQIITSSPLRLIRSSSASLAPQVMTALETTFKAPVIEAYGMTEASHQITSNLLPPNIRKPGSVGIAAGPQVAIMDETGNLFTANTVGEVVIRGVNVTSGYENNPTVNKEAFIKGWFRTGDLGYLDHDNYLFLKGRIKEIINRGGEKISPKEIDEVLLEHPAIAQVVTFAAPHTLLGEDVAVAVVLKDGYTASEMELKKFTAQKLADFKVPRVVLFLKEIPKGPTGKLQRIGLAEKLGLVASDPNAPKTEFVAPSSEIEQQLAAIWTEVLKIENIGINDNFFQLGGDSILATKIINRVRDSINTELSFLVFFQEPTIKTMAEKITQLQEKEVNDLLELLNNLSEDEAAELLKNKL